MRLNFGLKYSEGIVLDGQLYDLHNCYSLDRVCLFPAGKMASLHFNPDTGSAFGIRKLPVEFRFVGVSCLHITEGFATARARGLMRLGFKEAASRDYEWLIDPRSARPEDHLVFGFDDDEGEMHYFRVFAEEALAVVH